MGAIGPEVRIRCSWVLKSYFKRSSIYQKVMGGSQKRCIFSSEIGRIWAQGCRRIDVKYEQKQKSNKTRARNSLEVCEWTDKAEPGGSHPEHKALLDALCLVGTRLTGKNTHL